MAKKKKKIESKTVTSSRFGYSSKIAPKAISRTRSDISTWQMALRQADNIDNPRNTRLMLLYNDIMIDAHLTSQIELRYNAISGALFNLYRDKEIDEEATKLLETVFASELTESVFLSKFFGHSLVELDFKDGVYSCTLLPCTNVIQKRGELLLNDNEKPINYREVREYGAWILEFGKWDDYGLLNKAVPHVLFKKFAHSCWSELCEIYGIPPRYIKTDTGDVVAMDRAETMLRDMGSAAWFIIDQNEEFEFAKGADTNGDVYKNLIALCNNEISLLVSGAVIGQDTVNGSNSKEVTSLKLLERINQADKKAIASEWNTKIIPALVRIGYLPKGLEFRFEKEKDLDRLWTMVKDILPHKDVPNEYIKEKFGIECTDKKITTSTR